MAPEWRPPKARRACADLDSVRLMTLRSNTESGTA